MNEFGKALIIIGVALAIIGGLIVSGLGKGWLGRLPGDINITRPNFSFHFPLVTCLILSAVLTLILWLIQRGK